MTLRKWRHHRGLVQSKRRDHRFEYHLDLAVELHVFGALHRAAWHTSRALRCKPNEPNALTIKGRIQATHGRFEEALATFHLALDCSAESIHPPMREEFLVELASSAARCCIMLGLDAATGAERAAWHQRAAAWLDLVPGESQGVLREILREDRLLRPLLASRIAVIAMEVRR